MTAPHLAADPYKTGAFTTTSTVRRQQLEPNVYSWGVKFQPLPFQPIHDARWRIRDIKAMTGWSDRTIATVLGVSHPTVAALRQGRRGRVPLRARLMRVHDLVERVYMLSERNPESTEELLTANTPDGRSAFSLLAADRPADAYLAVTDVLYPPPEGLLTGSHPASVGNAIAPLAEE